MDIKGEQMGAHRIDKHPKVDIASKRRYKTVMIEALLLSLPQDESSIFIYYISNKKTNCNRLTVLIFAYVLYAVP